MTTATKAKKGGKGKAAAIEAPAAEIETVIGENELDVQQIPLEQIRVVDKNDRIRDEAFYASVRDLAASMAQHGLLQPITVRVVAFNDGEFGCAVIAGERRFLAAKLLKWDAISAIVIPKESPQETLDIRAAENLQRTDLDEDVKAMTVGAMLDREVRVLLDEQGVKNLSDLDAPAIDSVNVAATKRVASRIGWPVPRVRDYAFMGELPDEVLSLARQGRLPMSHLRVLAQVPDPKRAVQLAEEYAAGENPALEPVKSLDDLKTTVSRETCRLAGVPWDLTVAFAGAPACVKCPHNSANRTGLFDGADLKPDFTSQFDASQGPLNDRQIEVGLCSKLSCYRGKNAATKSAWRSAGDRIAAKVAAAKPAERPKLLPQLVKEAAAKCAFVPVTVMGKLVKGRAEQKLEAGSSKGKAKASADRSVKAGNDQITYQAKDRLRQAEYKLERQIEEMIQKAVMKLPAEQAALLELAVGWSGPGRRCFDYGGAKADDRLKFRVMLEAILRKTTHEAVRVIAEHPPKGDRLNLSGDLDDFADLIEVLQIQGIPPRPTLADFLPKPKAEEKKPAAGKKAKAKPAKKGKAKKAAKRSTGMPGIHEDDCVDDGVASDGGAGSEEA